MAVGAYEAMWLFVGFDLPTLTSLERRRAVIFRKNLVEMGFKMFQLSFYAYYFPSRQQADTISKRIEAMVPPEGTVSIFMSTDKQFGMIKTFFGGKQMLNEIPDQAIILD